MSPAKGELETIYGGPWAGIDYSRPYNCLDPQFIAPGSVNTSQINGFLTSAPWVASAPYATAFATGEYVLGTFQSNAIPSSLTGTAYSIALIVTTVGVYTSAGASISGGNLVPAPLNLMHTWATGGTPEIVTSYLVPGNAISFVEVNGTVYFTGLMLNGVFAYAADSETFTIATNYVSAAYIIELGGRLFVAQCRFPTGGGTGVDVLPTVAWSGPGEYSAIATAPLGSLTIVNGGTGFNIGDTFTPSDGSADAVVTVDTVDGSGAILTFTITNPGTAFPVYDSNVPLTVLTGSGSGATANVANNSDPWNPVNNLGGGFNELADVPDQITGLAGIGRSALIARNNGISQADPNPGTSVSGIQPYTFYHLWASPQGQGAVQGTFAQYGQQVTFLSGENVYTLSISGGLQPVGTKIIKKINSDFRSIQTQVGLVTRNVPKPSQWYFASFAIIGGELHYLLQWSAAYQNPGSTTILTKAAIYDCNVAENYAWHVSDLSQYVGSSGGGQPFAALSCPITQVVEGLKITNGLANLIISNPYILVGAYTSIGATVASGNIFQLVPWDYDYNEQWITTFNAALYSPVSMPLTNITFRGEVISLGHKISTRRLRVQADNAPLPSFTTGSQQQGTATFTGMLAGNVQSAPLAWNQNASAGQPVKFMQGNNPPLGKPIQTYYADMVLSDELVQPSIQGAVVDPSGPWDSLPAFRIATASLVLLDATGTTQ